MDYSHRKTATDAEDVRIRIPDVGFAIVNQEWSYRAYAKRWVFLSPVAVKAYNSRFPDGFGGSKSFSAERVVDEQHH